MMQRARPHVLLAVVCTSLVLGACGGVPERRDDVLDPRLAGPCERLILTWPKEASQLRNLMGDKFEPTTADGIGELQLHMLRCQSRNGRQPPLSFAFLSVPISANSAPLVITQMPVNGWAWLPAVIANMYSAPVFSAMGYDTELAEFAFDLDASGNHSQMMTQLIFESGGIVITASTAGEGIAHSANQALVSTNPQYHSVFFGKEIAARYELASIAVDVQGDTPLAAGDPDRQPERAVLDIGLRLDHVYWRLPLSEPEFEPAHSEEP